MHDITQKLEQQLAGVQNNPASASSFFDFFWRNVTVMPAAERRQVADKTYTWAKTQTGQQPAIYAWALLMSGLVYFHENDYAACIQWTLDAQKAFEDLNDADDLALCEFMFGATYHSLGNVELSLKHLLAAYNQLKQTGAYAFLKNIVLFQLAEVYAETRHYDEALQLNEENLKQAQDSGNMVGAGLALNSMAGVYRRQKKYEQALACYMNALEAFTRINEQPNVARVMTDMGDYYFETGDYIQSEKYNKEALAIRQTAKIPAGIITNMIHLAEIYEKESQHTQTIEILHKALAMAEELNLKPKLFKIHELLSIAYEALGDTGKSLAHYKTYHAIREEVEHEDSEKKVKNMQLILEAEQTRKENVIIKAQKAEIEHKNIELQNTIDELTLTRVSRKAKAITLIVAIVLFVIEEAILDFLVHPNLHVDNFFISLAANGVIVFSLKPIEHAIEHYLLDKIVKRPHALKTVNS